MSKKRKMMIGVAVDDEPMRGEGRNMKMRIIFVLSLIFCVVIVGFMPSGIEKVGIMGTATADYVDASNNTSCIEPDPLVPSWSKDVRLTNDSAISVHPSIATDSNGNPHVVWEDSGGEYWNIYYKRVVNGVWSDDKQITSKESHGPSIYIDPSDNIFIFYAMCESEDSVHSDIFCSKSEDGGNSWDQIKVTNSGYAGCPRVVFHNNTIHLVWQDYKNNNMEIYYKKSLDGGYNWCEEIRVTNTSTESKYPAIAIDVQENIHVVWQEKNESGYKVCYAKIENNGNNEIDVKTLSEVSKSYREPEVVVDAQNNIHVVWTDYRCHPANGEIFYKKSTNDGETWTEDVNITQHSYDTDSWMPYVALDSGDNLHLVWSGTNRTEDSNDIYYKTISDCGETLSQTIRLTHAMNGSRMHPKITIDKDNNVHLSWYDDRTGSGTKYLEIYYKRTLIPVTEPPITVTQSLNKTTCNPGDSITVSGNAVYNDSIVPNADVSIKILETGDEWNITTDSNGNYSKTIIAPDTTGNYTIRVTVTLGNLTGTKYAKLTVESEIVTNDGITNGGVQGDGGSGEGLNIIYLAIIGAIAGVVIVAFALLRMRKTEVTKVEKPTEEQKPELEFPSKIQTMTLRCPECKMTFSVEVKPKPFDVKCPNCGKEGTIK